MKKKNGVGRYGPFFVFCTLYTTRFLPFVFFYKYRVSSLCSFFPFSYFLSLFFATVFRRNSRQAAVVSAGHSLSAPPSPSSLRFSALSPRFTSQLHLFPLRFLRSVSFSMYRWIALIPPSQLPNLTLLSDLFFPFLNRVIMVILRF